MGGGVGGQQRGDGRVGLDETQAHGSQQRQAQPEGADEGAGIEHACAFVGDRGYEQRLGPGPFAVAPQEAADHVVVDVGDL
jgi:hypothetical protein